MRSLSSKIGDLAREWEATSVKEEEEVEQGETRALYCSLGQLTIN